MWQMFSRLIAAKSPDAGLQSLARRGRLRRYGWLAAQALESLEARTLLSSAPTGGITILNRTQIVGWAFNPDDGGAAINVQITVNGVETTLSTHDMSAAVPAKDGSPYHGFTFTMPTLPPGTSKVKIVAVSPTTGISKTIKSTTVTNPPPTGKVESLTDGEIIGWARDPDSAAPITVRIDVDGVAGTPFTTNVPRPDLLKKYHVDNLGFDVTDDYAGKVVEVYAIDVPTGQATLLFTNNHKPKGKVQINDGLTVSGYAQDPDGPSAAIMVRVDIDGQTLSSTPTPANIERDELTPLLGSPNHGFNITIPGLTPGKHTIAVYAIDGQASSAAPVLLQKKTVTDAVPVGKVEIVNSSVISGYALDPDLKTSPATVNVYVDDSSFATTTANLPSASAKKKYGSSVGLDHGFSVDLSSLPAGSHAIVVTVVDNRTSDENEVVIFDDFINNHVPTGAFDTATGSTIGGWAYDSDAGTDPIDVDIYVDGVYAMTTTADQPRNDVDGMLPSPNHAFSADLPTLSFGTHRIDAYAAESQGNVSVLIGTRKVTNNRPIGAIESGTATALTGWAADPDRIGESLAIQVYINGVLFLPIPETSSTATANIQRDDLLTNPKLAPMPDFSHYGYSIDLTSGLASGSNHVDVFAVDLNNSMISPLGSVVIVV